MFSYSTWTSLSLVVWHLAILSEAAFDLGYEDDSDLTRFVTRPEIKAPIFNITFRAAEGVSPGLWFLGPYAAVAQDPFPEYYYQACSTGPHIYDNNGDLVWSGACAARNQNACDFRMFADDEGNEYLSTIFHGYEKPLDAQASIWDSSYSLSTARNITPPPLDIGLNMHEFKVIENGRAALYNTHHPERIVIPKELNVSHIPVGWVSNVGFREVDTQTGDVNFEWWSFGPGKVSVTESSYPIDEEAMKGPFPRNWNFFHPNSVDKSAEGDYLVSGRFVDTIYKISGKDGSILWRLGGRNSSFVLEGFNFSKQHDAQFRGHDETGAELISFFDNAVAHQSGWESEATSQTSSCLVVALDHHKMTARVVKQIYRPDGGLTALRGNFMHLPNGNTVGSWSENAYVSEHLPDGRTVLEARFSSERFVTYRAYKYNFTGHPVEPPVFKAMVYGASRETASTAWYVSWNGATEVAEWRFCRDEKGGTSTVVGQTRKTGFETRFVSDGVEHRIYVEAVGRNGSVIGRSTSQEATHLFRQGVQETKSGRIGLSGPGAERHGSEWIKTELRDVSIQREKKVEAEEDDESGEGDGVETETETECESEDERRKFHDGQVEEERENNSEIDSKAGLEDEYMDDLTPEMGMRRP